MDESLIRSACDALPAKRREQQFRTSIARIAAHKGPREFAFSPCVEALPHIAV
jgi:hypothetical protein